MSRFLAYHIQASIALWNAWNAVLRQVGSKDFRLHDWRHSAASYLAMRGARRGVMHSAPGSDAMAVECQVRHTGLKEG